MITLEDCSLPLSQLVNLAPDSIRNQTHQQGHHKHTADRDEQGDAADHQRIPSPLLGLLAEGPVQARASEGEPTWELLYQSGLGKGD